MYRLPILLVLFASACALAQSPTKQITQWSLLGTTSVARTGACAVSMNDNRLMIVGGGPPGATSSVELLDNTGRIKAAAALSSGRARHSCTLLQDGRVLVAGGFDGTKGVNAAVIYDPVTEEWSTVGQLTEPRIGHTATLMMDGRVLIAGGENSPVVLDSMEIFDPATGAFSRVASMSSSRRNHAAAMLKDGRILIAGGSNAGGDLSSIEIYDPSTSRVELQGKLGTARSGLSATTLGDGTVLLAGGSSGDELLASAEVFDPASGVSYRTSSMTNARSGHMAFVVPGTGEVLLAGGDSGVGTAEMYSRASSGAVSRQASVSSTAALLQVTSIDGTIARTAAGSGAATLDQCANGSLSDNGGQIGIQCVNWVNGNLNGSKASYREGDAVAYRLRMTGVPAGVNTVTIEWDTTQGGKHALDYLTTFNLSVTGANPCVDSACPSGGPTTFAIPLDPNITNGGSQPQTMLSGRTQMGSQNFTMWGGSITGVGATPYTLNGPYTGNSATKITITFNSTSPTMVLAWGGHIARRVDWGNLYSAVAISGSPFHTRLNDLNGGGGNQDRALSSDAAIFPSSITVTKVVNTSVANDAFTFTSTPGIPDLDPINPVTSFTLPVANPNAPPAQLFTRVFDKILIASGTKTFVLNETNLPAGFTLQNLYCVKTGFPGSEQTTSSISLSLAEGDSWSCTYTNAAPVQVTVNKACTPSGDGGSFTLKINGGTGSTVSCGGSYNQTVGVGSSVTVSETSTTLANYDTSISCTNGSTSSTSQVTFTMPNSPVTCTITNTRKTYSVTMNKVCVPTTDTGKFNLGVNGSATEVGCGGSTFRTIAGGVAVTVTETAGAGTDINNYTSDIACVGISLGGSGLSRTFTMPDVAVTCTVTNRKPSVTVTKVCVPTEDSGLFTLQINSATSAAPVACGGTFSLVVGIGTSVTVTETGANLSSYTAAVSCGTSGSSQTASYTFTMPNSAVSCTITNTRKSYDVTVNKVCFPAGDPGKFNLGVNGSGSEVNCGGNIVRTAVGGTSVSITETAGTATDLTKYVSDVACTGINLGGSGLNRTFTMPDSAVTCTVTNRKPGVSVTKTCTAGVSLSNGVLAVSVNSSGQVCNTGGHMLTSLVLTDVQTIGGSTGVTGTVTFSTADLAPGDCRNYTSLFTPTQPSSGSCAPGDASCSMAFTDKVTISASAGNLNVTDFKTANCPLCK